jgi:hypothetical protein
MDSADLPLRSSPGAVRMTPRMLSGLAARIPISEGFEGHPMQTCVRLYKAVTRSLCPAGPTMAERSSERFVRLVRGAASTGAPGQAGVAAPSAEGASASFRIGLRT